MKKSKKVLILLLCFFYLSVYAQEQDIFEKEQDIQFELVNKKFTNLKNVKTNNFFINYSKATPENYPKTLEGLLVLFKMIFSTGSDEKLFKGRIEVYLWDKKNDYIRFANEFENFDSSNAAGYFNITKNGWPRFSIHLDTISGNIEASQTANFKVLFHEGTHAMFSQYLSESPLPTWINEGLAEYFAIAIFEEFYPQLKAKYDLKSPYLQFLKKQLAENKLRPFPQLFHQQGTANGNDYEAYALSWCLTSLMLKNYKEQIVAFIKKVKMSAEYKGPEIPKGPVSEKVHTEITQKLNELPMLRKKVLEDIFLECFNMDINKFGEFVYSQLKRNPKILDGI